MVPTAPQPPVPHATPACGWVTPTMSPRCEAQTTRAPLSPWSTLRCRTGVPGSQLAPLRHPVAHRRRRGLPGRKRLSQQPAPGDSAGSSPLLPHGKPPSRPQDHSNIIHRRQPRSRWPSGSPSCSGTAMAPVGTRAVPGAWRGLAPGPGSPGKGQGRGAGSAAPPWPRPFANPGAQPAACHGRATPVSPVRWPGATGRRRRWQAEWRWRAEHGADGACGWAAGSHGRPVLSPTAPAPECTVGTGPPHSQDPPPEGPRTPDWPSPEPWHGLAVSPVLSPTASRPHGTLPVPGPRRLSRGCPCLRATACSPRASQCRGCRRVWRLLSASLRRRLCTAPRPQGGFRRGVAPRGCRERHEGRWSHRWSICGTGQGPGPWWQCP